MTVEEKSDSGIWTREQDKAFENAIATHTEDSEDRWEKIAADVEGKTIEEVQSHYEILLEDITEIESGRVPLPSYSSSSDGSTGQGAEDSNGKKGHGGNESNHGGKASKADQERRKGIAWTEDEHRLFLLGLDKYGKGDWRSISRNFVVTRTPTQVASHAQKYFIRLNSMNKDRRRSSIHDITSVNSADVSTPITGQTNANAAALSGPGPSSVGGPRPMAPAIGTPVHMSAPPHMTYGVRVPVPVPGSVVPGAAMGMAPMHTIPHASTHR